MEKWKGYDDITSSKTQFAEATGYLHRAAQFIAIVGKHLVPQQDDDSNSSMGWDHDEDLLKGHVAAGERMIMALDIAGYSLQVRDIKDNILNEVSISAKMKSEIMNWLESSLRNLGISTSGLKYIDHYEVPKHPVDEGFPFEEIEPKVLEDWALIYNNADLILNQVSDKLDVNSSVRIWPHHFDIGSYFSLNESGTQAIGTGLAIPDKVENNFYYYIYGWRSEQPIVLKHLPDLDRGKWHTNEWQGATLPIQDLTDLSPGNQVKSILEFFDITIDYYLNALK